MDLLGEAVSFAGIEEAMADIEKSALSHPQPLINRGVQRRTEGREMLISFFSIVH